MGKEKMVGIYPEETAAGLGPDGGAGMGPTTKFGHFLNSLYPTTPAVTNPTAQTRNVFTSDEHIPAPPSFHSVIVALERGTKKDVYPAPMQPTPALAPTIAVVFANCATAYAETPVPTAQQPFSKGLNAPTTG